MAKVASRKRAKVSKSQKIRDVLTAEGVDTRTRDVIATLKEKGISVSSAQVSNVKAALRRQKNGAGPAGKGQSVPLAALEHATRLAGMTGGIENAKRLLDALAHVR